MSDTIAKQEHIQRTRDAWTRLNQAIIDLHEQRQVWDLMGFGSGSPDEITDADFTGGNADVTIAEFTSGWTTEGTFYDLYANQGHGTNIQRLRQ